MDNWSTSSPSMVADYTNNTIFTQLSLSPPSQLVPSHQLIGVNQQQMLHQGTTTSQSLITPLTFHQTASSSSPTSTGSAATSSAAIQAQFASPSQYQQAPQSQQQITMTPIPSVVNGAASAQQLLLLHQAQLQQQQQSQAVMMNGQSLPSLNNLYKTQLCKHFLQTKHCHVGSKCHFAHGEDELRRKEDPLPVDVQMKMLNIPYNNFKTQKCKYFYGSETPGVCKFGKNCSYAHGEEDLRNPYKGIDLPSLVHEHYGVAGYDPQAPPVATGAPQGPPMKGGAMVPSITTIKNEYGTTYLITQPNQPVLQRAASTPAPVVGQLQYIPKLVVNNGISAQQQNVQHIMINDGYGAKVHFQQQSPVMAYASSTQGNGNQSPFVMQMRPMNETGSPLELVNSMANLSLSQPQDNANGMQLQSNVPQVSQFSTLVGGQLVQQQAYPILTSSTPGIMTTTQQVFAIPGQHQQQQYVMMTPSTSHPLYGQQQNHLQKQQQFISQDGSPIYQQPLIKQSSTPQQVQQHQAWTLPSGPFPQMGSGGGGGFNYMLINPSSPYDAEEHSLDNISAGGGRE